MTQLIIALWLALMPAHHGSTNDNGTHICNLDTGGETEHIPPPPPPPHQG